MKRSAETPAFVVKVSPCRLLVRNGVLSYAFLSLPLFGALYFFNSLGTVWLAILGVHLLSLAAAAALYFRFTTLFIGVTSTAIHERGLFGRVKVMPLTMVGDAALVYTYRSSSTETVPQLLLRSADDKRLLRMRGVFWSETNMRAVAAVIGTPLTEREEPITSSTFFTEYPGSAYWFENRPALIAVAVLVTLLAVLGVVLVFMSLMGIPIGRI